MALLFKLGHDTVIEITDGEGGTIFFENSTGAVCAGLEGLDETLRATLRQFVQEVTRRGQHLATRAGVAAVRAGADPEETFSVNREPEPLETSNAERIFGSASGVRLRGGGLTHQGPLYG